MLIGVAVFSGVINVLALTGAIYMLQVYDRVIPSRSIPTLIGLTVLLVLLFVANGVLDLVRARIMSRVGLGVDEALRDDVFSAMQTVSLQSRGEGDGLQPVRDLDRVRSFLSGMGPAALFDLPWIPIYLVLIFMLHQGAEHALGPERQRKTGGCGSVRPERRGVPGHGDGTQPSWSVACPYRPSSR
jgi:ATP-binding cassette subfamily C protein